MANENFVERVLEKNSVLDSTKLPFFWQDRTYSCTNRRQPPYFSGFCRVAHAGTVFPKNYRELLQKGNVAPEFLARFACT